MRSNRDLKIGDDAIDVGGERGLAGVGGGDLAGSVGRKREHVRVANGPDGVEPGLALVVDGGKDLVGPSEEIGGPWSDLQGNRRRKAGLIKFRGAIV
jgi:hypothetical protein